MAAWGWLSLIWLTAEGPALAAEVAAWGWLSAMLVTGALAELAGATVAEDMDEDMDEVMAEDEAELEPEPPDAEPAPRASM